MSVTRLHRPLVSRAVRTAAVAAVCVATATLVAGCWNGTNAQTTQQATMNSGNGTQATLGPLRIENATVVLGEDGTGSLIMSVFNNGETADNLAGATVNGLPAAIPEGSELLPGGFRAYGYGVEGAPPAEFIVVAGLDVPPSTYVPVTLSFVNAGAVEMSVLTVPPAGIYAGLLPEGTP
ncbi:MAG: hypothetical protein ACKOT0_13465 [bacterium]